MDVVMTIESSMHREPDPVAGRERLFGRGGPDGWLRVVIEFDGDFDRLITVFSQSTDPRRGRRP